MKIIYYIGILLAAGWYTVLPAKDNAGRKPARAWDFINSIGVNTHFGYYDTQYGRYEEVLKPRLLELGVKHIRDGTYNDDVVRKYKEVGTAGVRLLLITQADKASAQVKAIGPMLWGVEAVNEPDGGRASGTWEQAARREQQRLYEAMKTDAALRSVPVVGISLANIKESPAQLGDISQWMDYGGMHPYAAGQHPCNHWGWGMPMADAIATARKVSGTKPMLVTECGYHNKENNPNHPGISERAAAIYHIHLPFVYFSQGIVRSYKYEFLDLKSDVGMTDMECHFGLVRSDGSVKPSFTALKNLLQLLNDTDKSFTLQPLPVQITAPDEAQVQSTLLQKSDGSWWLALFRNVTVYDLKNRRDVDVASVPVKLRFDRNVNTRLYCPNESAKAFLSVDRKKELSFELGAEAVLVEIKSR